MYVLWVDLLIDFNSISSYFTLTELHLLDIHVYIFCIVVTEEVFFYMVLYINDS